ncbi:MAG: ABC transporter substrate-binding protein [Deltaproteobacteria bacterium]|jgi:branched-chain amino acid transport system substrate-binding protein|nr:ABC transporter substrate-binding protein [Deltaproteobacteria bacterium]
MKSTFKFLFCLVIISAIAINLAAPLTGFASEPLVVGVPHSEAYTYANMMRNSFEMALEKVNKAGGIKGQPLNLVYANDQGKPKPGEKAIIELVEKKGAVMLVGAYQSSNTIFMARMADKLDRPLLVCTAADDRITQRKWKNVYRLNPPAQGYTNGLEDFFLNKIKPKSMAIVYENSPYGTSGAMRMMWFCRGNDIDLRAIEPYHKERLKPDYFKRIVARLKENPPDVIYMVSYLKDGAMLVKNIRDAKIKALLCGGAGGFTSQKFISAAGDSANHLLTATLWTACLKYAGTREYYDQYTEKYRTSPDYHGAEAYSALMVAADALKRADSYSPASIRAALDKTDMITPFGPVKFVSYENFERQNNLPTQVLQIINGKFECVWPQELATTHFVASPE